MSRYGSTTPGSGNQRNLVGENSLTAGVQIDSLQAPGIPQPVYVQPNTQLSQLLTTFGLVGGVAQQAGQLSAEETRKKQYALERADALDSAFYSHNAANDAVNIQQGIDQGKIKLPAGVKPSDFAEALLNSSIEKYGDVSPAGRRAYFEASAHVASSLEKQSAQQFQQDQAFAVRALSGQALLATSQAKVQEAIDNATTILGSQDKAYLLVAIPALEAAARSGNTESFNSIKATLPPDTFAEDIAKQTIELKNATIHAENQKYAAGQDQIERLFDANASSSIINQQIDALSKHGQLAPYAATVQRSRLATRDAQQQLDTENSIVQGITLKATAGVSDEELRNDFETLGAINPTKAIDAENSVRIIRNRQMEEQTKAFKSNIAAIAVGDAVTASLSGRPLSLTEDVKTTLPNGETHTTSRDTIIQQATDAALVQVSQGKSPEQARAAQVDWAASNAVYPRQFVHLVESAPALAAQVSEGGPVPQSLLAAVAFWETSKQRANGWSQGLGDERGRAFLDAAAINLRDSNLTPAQAIQMASKVATATPEEREAAAKAINQDAVKKAVRALPSDVRGALNYPIVEATIREQARTRFLGTASSSAALTSTVADYSGIVLGKWASPTNQADMTPELLSKLPDLSTELSRAYVKTNGGNLDGHALVWSQAKGVWEINNALGVPVTGPRSKFTTAQLAQIANTKTIDAENTDLADVVKTVNAKQDAMLEKAMAPDRAIFGGAGNYEQMKADALKRMQAKPYKLFAPSTEP